MKRFGTFAGVFVPSFEAILGAVLFIILPMLTGVMGFWQMVLIIVLANTVTLATGFSISDCTTNLVKVGAGGMYAISKSSLGKAFGGSIGIQLFIAQAASIGFYCIAFASPLPNILINIPLINSIIGEFSVTTRTQIIAAVFAILAFILALIGADFVVKIQIFIFVILVISVGSIAISPLLVPAASAGSPFTNSINFNGSILNIKDGILIVGFMAAFTLFFPAVTGIDAGVGMSGKLKNPRKSLPKGTFLAVGITLIVYLGITYVFSLISAEKLFIQDGDKFLEIPANEIFASIPIISILLLIGILVAAGSSGIAYFLTAPRTVQALAKDNVLPGFLSFLGRDFTKNGKEPRWATVLTFFIVISVIAIGDIVTASMVVGICFLVVYGWINLAAFLERISGNPSFRPTSKGHWLISLYGFSICMIVISLFNIWVGIAVISSQLIIFLLILKYKAQNRLEGVWWGVIFSLLNWVLKRMKKIIQGTKNWRPIVSIFAMSDQDIVAEKTISMGKKIADYQGLVMLNVLKPQKQEEGTFNFPEDAQLVSIEDDDFDKSISSIVQSAMPGGFNINTILLPIDNRLNYVDIIETIIKLDRNVLLYLDGEIQEPGSNRIDVWWKGEENGNFMALLSYIISRSDEKSGKPLMKIRLIRKLFKGEEEDKARKEIQQLQDSARLAGEILIIPDDNETIQETIRNISSDAILVLMGMPGKKASGIVRFFSLDRMFFTKEINKFQDLPPLLFVKACRVMKLFE